MATEHTLELFNEGPKKTMGRIIGASSYTFACSIFETSLVIVLSLFSLQRKNIEIGIKLHVGDHVIFYYFLVPVLPFL